MAKNKLEKYVRAIDPKLAKFFEEEIKGEFGFNERQKQVVRELLEHSKEHNLRSAKRLRGSFVNYGFMLGSGEINECVWRAAMGVELVHTALLMHDDFMDQDLVRRGGPTTQAYYGSRVLGGGHYGESMAVSAGDAILSMGYELLLECGFPKERVVPAIRQMLRGIVNTSYGQAYDVTLEVLRDWNENDVLALHQAKTAIYTYQNPLFVGAHLAGLSGGVFDILHDYAMSGGVAFQLQDDILGVFGTPEKTGKSADSDLLQGKCTLLVLKLLEEGTEKQKMAIKKVWGKRKATRENLEAAKKAIAESGSLQYSRELARELAAKAAGQAARLRELDLNPEAIDYIQGIAEYMVEREV